MATESTAKEIPKQNGGAALRLVVPEVMANKSIKSGGADHSEDTQPPTQAGTRRMQGIRVSISNVEPRR